MKPQPQWTQTLWWIAAVITALLLALASPDGFGPDAYRPQGAMAPR